MIAETVIWINSGITINVDVSVKKFHVCECICNVAAAVVNLLVKMEIILKVFWMIQRLSVIKL